MLTEWLEGPREIVDLSPANAVELVIFHHYCDGAAPSLR